ncbi:hypothetical protein GCM10011507_26410 [Edaphobacter acidisoli]|uniref:TolB-like protein n=1 Tax=Edaphobacter acidisoli TaxID=2040573 RepID=A0A916RW69_9BACT|nr:tetratricopeptide repeat protein [Edaphobacter acidisoli]GGA73543.1 hypothetical protein GCM10011507_26410 [Edaphobacter acidisoli]
MPNTAPSPLHEAEVLSPEQIALVREHLEEVLASKTLAGSKRTQEFLRLVVTHALDGEKDSLRERMIGAELFRRPVGYDTGNDSVVRVRASETRKRLARYYGAEAKDGKPPVRIELLSGSYMPRFHFEPARSEQSSIKEIAQRTEPAETRRPVSPPFRLGRVALLASVAVAIIAISGWIAFKKWHNVSLASKGIHSIAVLPFDNLSGAPAQDYFADGLTEELINDLGQVSTLRIISFTSSMSFKGTQKKLPEIAKELAVDGVVEGGILRDGNQVRISVQLIDARTDRPVWASTYVQDISRVFAWQGEVVQEIAEEISTKVTPQEQARLDRTHPVDPQAQDLYLHGLLLRNRSDCQRALDYFRQAIGISPDYARAHSALASCYGLMGESGQMPYEQAFTLQKTEALKAIGLNDSLSEAHAELANTAMTLDRDWPAAAAEFRQALNLNPSSATNHEKYAFYLVRTGHPQEAIAEIEQSVDLDPVSASTFHAEGFIYYFAHQYDQALSVTRTVQGLDIGLPDWNFLLGAIYAAKNMYPESIHAFLESRTGPYTLGHLGNVYARDGQIVAAKKIIPLLEENVQKNGVGRYEIALVYAGLGEKDQAFRWLEDALQAHDVGLVYLQVDPCLDPLRSDPRFPRLLQQTGIK